MALSSERIEKLERIAKAAIVPDSRVMQDELKILAKAVLELNKQMNQMEGQILNLTHRLGPPR